MRVGSRSAEESTGRTVLMVDDDPDVRTSVARGVAALGIRRSGGRQRREALRLLASENHDALVVDVQMPGNSMASRW